MDVLVDGVLVLAGLVVLIAGGHWLLRGAVELSLRLSIPKIVIGMTVVSLATSAPELIVSAQAALAGYPDLALGNVVGSNTANLGLVLAVTLLIGHVNVRPAFYVTDWPVMMAASLLFYFFLASGPGLSRSEGLIMVGCLFAFLIYLLRFQKPAVVEELPVARRPLPLYKMALLLLVGGVALWAGSELLVRGATSLAADLGVSDRVIGITVVSVGTSIPELAASVIAMAKREKAMSVGNLIGSNIFNLLAVLGLTAILAPVPVLDDRLLTRDVFWMLGISFLVLPLVFFPKGLRLGWRDGIVLLACYGAFLWSTLQ
ncbi:MULTISPECIES: calcium/sodium antiporter [Robiginitalea]|uniref:calcium/sodium antiporter n=1 Tax=Robiginitalea TaxID=252306 RepID=UPI002349D2CD|nr:MULTISPECIES: calcium/sodium antiporter [unclassified Robiginitalea]MDC6355323.1 calcium/sodium antiporter [Robiginitalea sp. PM2]MDC6375462.1 calcium/sodium antiporter [Robiginitalea sp. SP8]